MTYRSIGDTLTSEQLLAEIDDILRSMPPRANFQGHSGESIEWTGRAAAAISRWDFARTTSVDLAVDSMDATRDIVSNAKGLNKLIALLNQARADLRMTVGPLSVLVKKGQVFDYFDELRKVVEPARLEVFFVDPYLDAEFASRYLPYISPGTAARLLGGPKRMATLLPAVEAFSQQSKLLIQVRSSNDLHDRYLFVDRASCFLSGASFKDGAKNAPVVLTQISDGFQAMWDAYESAWQRAKVER